MGLAIGNELELLTDHAEPECIRQRLGRRRKWWKWWMRLGLLGFKPPNLVGGLDFFLIFHNIWDNPSH